jgi:hypothetical protein
VATTLPEVRDRAHLAELTGAADLALPSAEDLDRLAELREANFGLDSRTAS